MKTFIEENKGLLRACYLSATIVGWLLLVFGCLAVAGHSLALYTRIGNWEMFKDYYFYSVPWNVINGVPIGLLALGIGQFIRYVYDNDYKPGWFLRNAQGFLYIFAVVFGVSIIFTTIVAFPYWNHWAEITIRLLGAIIWGIGKALLLVAAALILKRVMPVIEESKTLV
ncbi:MAG: hypothetical protein ACYTFK_08095 [Planctomycetota bacterium]|jgi:hypothetical protein